MFSKNKLVCRKLTVNEKPLSHSTEKVIRGMLVDEIEVI